LQTAESICVEASIGNLRRDERLREREFGALDRLTSSGIQQRFPAEAEARARIGKFYYRPPGGESWCDVALRVRSMIGTLAEDFADRDVIAVAHEVVILLFRYVIQDLTEEDVLEISRSAPMANCAVTTFVRQPGGSQLLLQTYGETLPVEESDATVTAESDAPVAPR
jgi:broad specificity phosphatase PhoE